MRRAIVDPLLLVLLLSGLSACGSTVNTNDGASEDTSKIQFVASDFYKDNGYPFSELVEADGWVFLSGAIGNAPGAGLVPGGIKPEARQTMENIKASLERIGLTMNEVVKCTVMIADMSEWGTFNGVYKEFFNGNYPSRSAFGANGLALGARVEVECIARRPQRR